MGMYQSHFRLKLINIFANKGSPRKLTINLCFKNYKTLQRDTYLIMICMNVLTLVMSVSGTFDLNPDKYPNPRRYCLRGWKPPVPHRQLDPTGKYSCDAGETCQQIPDSQYGQCVPDPDPTAKYCSDQGQCLTGETCKAVAGSPYGQCTPRYCLSDDECESNEKCASLGILSKGICKLKWDPTGKYCRRNHDCRWYILEVCHRYECTKVISG